MGNKAIIYAISSLYDRVETSFLTTGEKNALKALLSQLKTYGENRYNEIMANRVIKNKSNRILALDSEMTDYLVEINDATYGVIDVFSVVNKIYKAINYDEKKGKFKRKRLI